MLSCRAQHSRSSTKSEPHRRWCDEEPARSRGPSDERTSTSRATRLDTNRQEERRETRIYGLPFTACFSLRQPPPPRCHPVLAAAPPGPTHRGRPAVPTRGPRRGRLGLRRRGAARTGLQLLRRCKALAIRRWRLPRGGRGAGAARARRRTFGHRLTGPPSPYWPTAGWDVAERGGPATGRVHGDDGIAARGSRACGQPPAPRVCVVCVWPSAPACFVGSIALRTSCPAPSSRVRRDVPPPPPPGPLSSRVRLISGSRQARRRPLCSALLGAVFVHGTNTANFRFALAVRSIDELINDIRRIRLVVKVSRVPKYVLEP